MLLNILCPLCSQSLVAKAEVDQIILFSVAGEIIAICLHLFVVNEIIMSLLVPSYRAMVFMLLY